MTWIVRVYLDGRLVYEENPYQVEPPHSAPPKALMPTCLITMDRKPEQVLINQIWDHPAEKTEQRKREWKKGICVIRMGGIGDLVALSSSMKELKRRDKYCPLTLATLPKNMFLFKGMPWLDAVIPISDLQYQRYDRMIDLRWAAEPKEIGDGKAKWEDYTQKDRSDIFDELLGVYPAPKRFEFAIDPQAKKKMQEALKPISKMPVIGINAICHAPRRSIPPEYVKPLCDLIRQEKKTGVVLFGQSQTWSKTLSWIKGPNIINLIDKTTGPEMVALCSLLDTLIAPDTGSVHVCGSLGIKTLALFGNINPRTRISYYPSVKPLYPHGELPCIPCWDVPNPCMDLKQGGAKCMRLLSPNRILEAL